MTGYVEFMKIFGGIPLIFVIELILVIVFLVFVYRKIRDYLIKKHDQEQEKAVQLKEALEAMRNYPTYRAQSVQIQQHLESEISELRTGQEEISKRLIQMEQDEQRRERNKLRDRLAQSYRYYISREHNPLQMWTRMKAETFWECFGDYESVNGDGYMHAVVQPQMNMLGVVEMDDLDGIANLMQHRK